MDKVVGKMPESVCIELLEKYQSEQTSLAEEAEQNETKLNAVRQDDPDV